MSNESTQAPTGLGVSSVRPCACAHEFQDREHGPGLRVKNRCLMPGATSKQGRRCTVCGAVEEVKVPGQKED